MSKNTGIKSVDLLITAEGEGVINHNGTMPVYNPSAGQMVKNHLMPKLRGFDPIMVSKKTNKEGEEYLGSVSLADERFQTCELLVSSTCVRHYLFKDDMFGVKSITTKNVSNALANMVGLVRGYLLDGTNFARRSPLYMTDFIAKNPNLGYDQHINTYSFQGDNPTEDETSNPKPKANAKNKEAKEGDENKKSENSMYSCFHTGDLKYEAKASFGIEDLQFIPMENNLGRTAFHATVNEAIGTPVASKITNFLQEIKQSDGLDPQVTFHLKVKRVGTWGDEVEAGLLFNDDAIKVILTEMIERIQTLYIRQGKGYMNVVNVDVDYNNSKQAFRHSMYHNSEIDTMTFHRYYEVV